MRAILLVVACGLFARSPLAAQGSTRAGLAPFARAPMPLVTRTEPSLRLSFDSVHHTHWKKGAIIGGAIGFPIGFAGFSSLSDGTNGQKIRDGLLGGLGFALIFGIIGGLIGSLFPK